jgi:hypothetical protein
MVWTQQRVAERQVGVGAAMCRHWRAINSCQKTEPRLKSDDLLDVWHFGRIIDRSALPTKSDRADRALNREHRTSSTNVLADDLDCVVAGGD